LRRTRAEPDDPARLPAWLSYGGTLTGTLDLTGTQRRLDLELFAAFTDPWTGAADVPFTRAVSLGGARPMRGFGTQRFMDRSAVVGTLRYRWPVWQMLDGSLHAAAGNVFGRWLRGFSPDELRASLGVGMATATSSTQAFELLLAFGTRPFRDGAAVESTRLAVGTTLAF
jgi:outer membrane protein assembly factor BamA